MTMTRRKLIGWVLIVVAVASMVFGDLGTGVFWIALAVEFSAMAVLALGLVLIAT